MKILVISHMYPSISRGTYGNFVHNQVKALVNRGCEVRVISPVPYTFYPLNNLSVKWNNYHNIPKRDSIDGIDVYYPRYIEFPGGVLFEHSGYMMYRGINNTVKEIYKTFKFDVIHSHVVIPDGAAGVYINNIYGVPHVVNIHGQDLQQTIHRGDKIRSKLFSTLKRIDGIVTVSSKLKNIISNKELYNKTFVVNNGVNLEDCQKIDKDLIERYKDYNILLSVSNLIDTKGIDLNIKAMVDIVKKVPNSKYLIIGSGVENEGLKKLARELGLEKNIEFLGSLSYEEVMKYMAICDVFSLPSWKEGFGVVYLEAMVNGKPAIGVLGEGIQDIIINGENGFLVRPKNVEDISQIVIDLFNNKEKAKLIGDRARVDVINKFTWDESAKKLMDIYNSYLV